MLVSSGFILFSFSDNESVGYFLIIGEYFKVKRLNLVFISFLAIFCESKISL